MRCAVLVLAVWLSAGAACAGDTELAPLVGRLEPGDIAALKQSLTAKTELMSPEGGASFSLYEAFAARGWMRDTLAPAGGPVGLTFHMFSVTPAGEFAIPSVLTEAGKS